MSPRQVMAADARRLHDDGVHWREATVRMGIGRSYYYELLSDPDGAKVAARKAKAGGTCETCGAPTSYGRGGGSPHRHCSAHNPGHVLSAQLQHERALPRRRQVQQLWADGLTVAQIAERVGTTTGTIGVLMVAMRKQGWDLPYRPGNAGRLRSERADPRRRYVQELWVEGRTVAEIAEITDSTPSAIGTLISRMRSLGWDMPHRRHPSVQT